MSLDTDALIERRRLARRLTAWRLVAVIALVVLAIAVVAGPAGLRFPRDFIGRLSVAGVILNDEGRTRELAAFAENSRARALIVHIDSPGGTTVGGETLYRALLKVAEKKPVVAVMETTATSAAYLTALGADHILARETTITGSIGVIVQAPEFSDLLSKLGIKVEEIKSSPLKAEPSPFAALDDEAREATEAVVLDIYDWFVDIFAERRDLAPAPAKALADGRVYSGRQALGLGLIDGIGGEDEARQWLEAERDISIELPVVDVAEDPQATLIGQLAQAVAGKILVSERLTLDGLVSLWHPNL